MPEFDSLAIPRDVKLLCIEAPENHRYVVHLVDDFKNYLGPVANDEERCIGMVKEGHIQDSTIFVDEVIQTNP